MMPGHADRQHVRGADGRADDAGALVELLGHDRLQPLGQLVVSSSSARRRRRRGGSRWRAPGTRGPDDRCRRAPAWAIRIEALLAAVVGMRAPADVGEQAGGVAQAPLLRRVSLGPGGSNSASVQVHSSQACSAERERRRAYSAQKRQQRILAALVLRQQAVEQAFADAEHGEVHLARLQPLQQALEHQRAVGQHLAPRPWRSPRCPACAESFLVLRISSQKSIASSVGIA